MKDQKDRMYPHGSGILQILFFRLPFVHGREQSGPEVSNRSQHICMTHGSLGMSISEGSFVDKGGNVDDRAPKRGYIDEVPRQKSR